MRQAVVLCTAFALGLGAAVVARAQTPAEDYPQRTVTFLCPFPAGGGTDILTRLLAHELQDKLKRPVVVDNRPGGGTIVAAQAAARAAPDGYTILLAPVTRSPWVPASTSRCPTTQ
jgi:tripartite-type tricarboxylate transporter receptor subunit TctC